MLAHAFIIYVFDFCSWDGLQKNYFTYAEQIADENTIVRLKEAEERLRQLHEQYKKELKEVREQQESLQSSLEELKQGMLSILHDIVQCTLKHALFP